MNEDTQEQFDFMPLPTFRVGAVISGERQVFEFEAVDESQAIKFVRDEFPTAKPILATKK